MPRLPSPAWRNGRCKAYQAWTPTALTGDIDLVYKDVATGDLLLQGDHLYLNGGVVNRNVDLPPEADSVGVMLTVFNIGTTNTITLRDDSGVSTILVMNPGDRALVFCDGTSWRAGQLACSGAGLALEDATSYFYDEADATKQFSVQVSGVTAGQNRVMTVLDRNWTPGIYWDSEFRVLGSADQTKQLAFEVDGFTATTTRTITPLDRDWTVGIYDDDEFYVRGSADQTKRLRFEVDGFTASSDRVVTPLDRDFTVGLYNSDELYVRDVTDPTKRLSFGVAGITASTDRVFTVLDRNFTVGLYNSDELYVRDVTDPTKRFAFDVSGVTASTDRVMAVLDRDWTPGIYNSDEFYVRDVTDPTKRLLWNVAGITATTDRTITMLDRDLTLGQYLTTEFLVSDNTDPTKGFDLDVSGVTASTTRTMAVLDRDWTPGVYNSDEFYLRDVTDPTKRVLWEASAISASTDRTVSMPDWDVELDNVVLYASTTVAFAAVRTLNAAPVIVAPAAPAGYYTEFVSAEVFLDFNSAAYDAVAGGDDITFHYGAAYAATAEVSGRIAGAGFGDAVADARRMVGPRGGTGVTADFIPQAATGIYMTILVGEWYGTVGDSPLKVRVAYRLRKAAV